MSLSAHCLRAFTLLALCTAIAACDGKTSNNGADSDTNADNDSEATSGGDSNGGANTTTDVTVITPKEVRPVLDALPSNPTRPPAALVSLGKLLFWDPILSPQQDIACASCHHPDFAYSDGMFASLGTGAHGLGLNRSGGFRTTRNSPTVVNTAFNGWTQDEHPEPEQAPMFWDSRETSLEAQAEQPLISAIEMRGELTSEERVIPLLLERLNENSQYRELFSQAFDQPIETLITKAQLLQAIASFERNLVSNNSRFDQFMRGDQGALDKKEQQGLKKFIETGCTGCHSGPMFSDFKLHILGVPDNPDNPNGVDEGANLEFSFRTPSLRNVELTPPYTHSGMREDLAAMMQFYVGATRGVSQNSQVNPSDIDTLVRNMTRVDSVEKDIQVFLKTLTDTGVDREIPSSVPSGLTVGGNIGE